MIRIPFIIAEAVFTFVWIAVRMAVWHKQKKIDGRREAALLLLYIDLFFMIRFTLFPYSLHEGRIQPLIFDPEEMFPLSINLIPFVRLNDYAYESDLWLNVFGNIYLFMPTGFIFPLLDRRLDSFKKTVTAGALLSIVIELCQLPFYERTTDIDDVIFNVIGTALGYTIYAVVKKAWKHK